MKREARHGTAGGYNGGCRCDKCKAAWAEDARAKRAKMKARIIAGEVAADDPRHGTRAFFGNYGCPCEICRAANREWQARAVAYRRENLDSLTFKHGSNGYSNYGCRCDTCRFAWNASCREQYAKRKAAKNG